MDIETILKHPATSYWLKKAIMSALARDVVDAARDAETLARLMRDQARLAEMAR